METSNRCEFIFPIGELKFQRCNLKTHDNMCTFHKNIFGSGRAKLWAYYIKPSCNDSQYVYDEFPKEKYKEYHDWYFHHDCDSSEDN
jgi:hypothetical protein